MTWCSRATSQVKPKKSSFYHLNDNLLNKWGLGRYKGILISDRVQNCKYWTISWKPHIGFYRQLYFYIKWQHVAVIMGRKEHSHQRFFLNCLQAGCSKKEQGWPSPSTTSSDLCSGFQLVSRFMTSFFLLSIWLPGSTVRNSQSCCRRRCSTHLSFVTQQRLFGRPQCLLLNTAENFLRALYN